MGFVQVLGVPWEIMKTMRRTAMGRGPSIWGMQMK